MKETKGLLIIYGVFFALNFLIYSESFGNKNNYTTLWVLSTLFYAFKIIMLGVRLEILKNK